VSISARLRINEEAVACYSTGIPQEKNGIGTEEIWLALSAIAKNGQI
jgi:hypothetical protein